MAVSSFDSDRRWLARTFAGCYQPARGSCSWGFSPPDNGAGLNTRGTLAESVNPAIPAFAEPSARTHHNPKPNCVEAAGGRVEKTEASAAVV